MKILSPRLLSPNESIIYCMILGMILFVTAREIGSVIDSNLDNVSLLQVLFLRFLYFKDS